MAPLIPINHECTLPQSVGGKASTVIDFRQQRVVLPERGDLWQHAWNGST